MAKYIRLTTSERILASGQIWSSGESNFQTFASSGIVATSGIARYPYDFGIVGQDILVDVSGIPQSLKMDAFQGIDNRMLIYAIPRRDGDGSNILVPSGLEWQD